MQIDISIICEYKWSFFFDSESNESWKLGQTKFTNRLILNYISLP